jgi:uncharacterized protein YndB with AHSA1/START domain
VSEPRSIEIERTYEASPAEVWEMWTTIDGIESWWGPHGFGVEVHELDVSPGGKMRYTMTAKADEVRAFMESHGMPPATTHDIFFVEIVPYRRLVYSNVVDFFPGVDRYDAETRVDLEPTATGTRLVVTLQAMHDDETTERAAAGWTQELEKLTLALEERSV